MLQEAFSEAVAYSFMIHEVPCEMPVCMYKIMMWYVLKMELLFSCLKKQQCQSQLKGKINELGMGLYMAIQKAFPYSLAPQPSSWLSSRSCAGGTGCSAVLAQPFLPQVLGGGSALVKQSDDCLLRHYHLWSLFQVLKSCFCCNCCRWHRSIHCIGLFQSLIWKHS